MSKLFDELVEGLNAYKDFTQGKITLRTQTLEKVEPAQISADEIKEIREKLKLSQAVFAHKLRTSLRTYQGWEQGRAKPNPQATLLLRMVDKSPQTFELIAGA